MIQSRNVALVEDDPTVRRALKRILSTMDFDVSAFASAEDFLAVGRTDHFDCLLLDLQLCGLNGLELYMLLENQNRALPVVFISASKEALGAMEEAAGPKNRGLLKPINADRLLAAVSQTIHDSRHDRTIDPPSSLTL